MTVRPLRICLLCVEIFAWGKFGGFGRATRTIGRELVNKGHEVTAIVPRRNGQAEVELLDGIRVLGYREYQPWAISRLARAADADVYHSCEPSLATFMARSAMPHRRHIVTFRDPRTLRDWRVEMALPSANRIQVAKNFLFENNNFVTRAVRKADAVFTAYRDAASKVVCRYGLSEQPGFLPTPVSIPSRSLKHPTPTVCYVGRLDRRKRPELLIPVARSLPNVRFLIAGSSRDELWERMLRTELGALPNVQLLGFVDQFASPLHQQVLSESWILINTSAREGLPNSFIEAVASGCAILSSNNPDGFASNFGEYVTNDDFASGLERLLEDNRWRARGNAGREYVISTFATDVAIRRHLTAYANVLATDKMPSR